MTDYYDVRLKQRRHAMLNQHEGFSATEAILEDHERLNEVMIAFRPDAIVQRDGMRAHVGRETFVNGINI